MKGPEAKDHTMCHSSEWVVNFYPCSRLIKQGSNPWLHNMVKKEKKKKKEKACWEYFDRYLDGGMIKN